MVNKDAYIICFREHPVYMNTSDVKAPCR